MNKLIHFFIRRTLLVNLIIVLVLGIGYIRLKNTPKESYPHVERKILWITTIYPGAAPEEVEINVTIPIEDAIKGVDGVKEYSSQSFENVSRVHVILDDEIKDVEKVKNDIRRSIDSVDLPKEVNKKPTIWEWKISTFPVMEIGVFSEKLSYSALRTRVKDLKKKLQEISYISKVEFKGMKEKEIRIELDLNQLEKHYISIQEIIQTIQANNISVTGGVFEENNINTILTVFSKLKNVEDVGNIILRSTFYGKKIF